MRGQVVLLRIILAFITGHGDFWNGCGWRSLGRSLRRAALVVATEVAVLAETLGVVGLAGVRAGPRLLGATTSVVTVGAHALRVVLAIGVRTVRDHLLGKLGVWAWNTWNFNTIFGWHFFVKNMA